MFGVFETVAAVQVSVAEVEQAPQNEGRGQPAPYCIIA
uniref:Mating factor a2.1 n=1 Tax=Macalpinomyces eriachnes TaxID=307738 RepID=H2CZ39_9BASI|nr:mating factor a2.1 [Macalpinomyces eriachnes]